MKEYKSFFVKLFVFCVLAIVVDVLCGIVFRKLEYQAVARSPHEMIVETVVDSVSSDVVLIGGSEVNHSINSNIISDSLGVSVYNCGKDAVRFYVQNVFINSILDRYTPKMIVWSVSPEKLATPVEEDKGLLSQLNPLYRKNKYAKEALCSKSKYEPVKLLSQAYTYNSQLLIYLSKIIKPESDEFQAMNGYSPLPIRDREVEIHERDWIEEYDTAVVKKFKSTLSRCAEKGAKVVFVFVPRYEIEEHDDSKSYQMLMSIAREYDIPVIEEFYHYEPLMESKYFNDFAHLNANGTQIFTPLLASRLCDYWSREDQ